MISPIQLYTSDIVSFSPKTAVVLLVFISSRRLFCGRILTLWTKIAPTWLSLYPCPPFNPTCCLQEGAIPVAYEAEADEAFPEEESRLQTYFAHLQVSTKPPGKLHRIGL